MCSECEEPWRQEACEDDSVKVKVMSLNQARAAAAELKLFLEENKCKSQDDTKQVCAEPLTLASPCKTSTRAF